MQAKHGDVFTLRAMNGTVVCTCHPDGAKAVFATPKEATAPFAPEVVRPLVGRHAVIVLEGVEHQRERKVLMPAFHGPRMRACGEAITEVAAERIAGWSAGDTLVVQQEMLEITFRIIVRVIFGVTDRARVERYVGALRALISELSPAFLFFRALQQTWLPQWHRFVAAKALVDELLFEDIAAARAAERDGFDVLSLLLQSTYEDGTQMSDEAIRDELITLLFAGHETTAIALAWCVSRRARHPEADAWLREAVAQEERGHVGAFAKEVLRLDTVVPDVLRTLRQPLEIAPGVVVPVGCDVAVIVDRLHRRPDAWDAPDDFRPERFVGAKPSPYVYMPFGGGLRRCVGAALAMYELELVLSELVRSAELEVISDDQWIRRNVVMGPSEGVVARVR